MRPASPDQQHDQGKDQEYPDELRGPENAAAESGDEHVHADMTTEPLTVGDTDERDERHRLLDPVDIAGYRVVEEVAATDARDGEDDQRQDRESAGERQDRFDAVEMTVESAEERAVLEDRRCSRHTGSPGGKSPVGPLHVAGTTDDPGKMTLERVSRR